MSLPLRINVKNWVFYLVNWVSYVLHMFHSISLREHEKVHIAEGSWPA